MAPKISASKVVKSNLEEPSTSFTGLVSSQTSGIVTTFDSGEVLTIISNVKEASKQPVASSVNLT